MNNNYSEIIAQLVSATSFASEHDADINFARREAVLFLKNNLCFYKLTRCADGTNYWNTGCGEHGFSADFGEFCSDCGRKIDLSKA